MLIQVMYVSLVLLALGLHTRPPTQHFIQISTMQKAPRPSPNGTKYNIPTHTTNSRMLIYRTKQSPDNSLTRSNTINSPHHIPHHPYSRNRLHQYTGCKDPAEEDDVALRRSIDIDAVAAM